MGSARSKVVIRRKIGVVKHDIPVLQLERHPKWIGETALESLHLPLVVQRSVNVLQMRVIQVLIPDRLDVEINNDIPVPQKNGGLIVQPMRAPILRQIRAFRHHIHRSGQTVIAIGKSHPLYDQ